MLALPSWAWRSAGTWSVLLLNMSWPRATDSRAALVPCGPPGRFIHALKMSLPTPPDTQGFDKKLVHGALGPRALGGEEARTFRKCCAGIEDLVSEHPEHELRDLVGVGIVWRGSQQECSSRPLDLTANVVDAGPSIPEHGAIEVDVGINQRTPE